jgi:translation initiation factor IF-3
MINGRIKSEELQLINFDGENLGVISKASALGVAKEAGMDLVLISETGNEGAPVAKVMDFGRSQYDKKKKLTEAKKKQTVIKVKEVKLRPKIGVHDYDTKLNRGIQFLGEGKRLKVTVMFRGRENANKKELGDTLFDRVHQTLVSHFGESSLVGESESRSGNFWSKLYYVKEK